MPRKTSGMFVGTRAAISAGPIVATMGNAMPLGRREPVTAIGGSSVYNGSCARAHHAAHAKANTNARSRRTLMMMPQRDDVIDDIVELLVTQHFGGELRHDAKSVADLEFHEEAR